MKKTREGNFQNFLTKRYFLSAAYFDNIVDDTLTKNFNT